MNQIRQYRPSYFEGFGNEVADFSTAEELLEIPFVKNFKKNGEFYQFSLSDSHLMAEYRNGREWWVVGIVSDASKVLLPKWNGGKA